MRRTVVGGRWVVLSPASGAPAATGRPVADMPTQNTGVVHEITFGEEESA
jgi:hypothetical protein